MLQTNVVNVFCWKLLQHSIDFIKEVSYLFHGTIKVFLKNTPQNIIFFIPALFRLNYWSKIKYLSAYNTKGVFNKKKPNYKV